MAAVIALCTGLCGFRKKTQPLKKIESGNQSSTIKEEQTKDDLQSKKHDDPDTTNAPNEDSNEANHDLPLPPARKAALHETYSCNNIVLPKSMSTKNKLKSSLTIHMPRVLSMAHNKRDGEEEKSVKQKKLKADQKSILVHPIIRGEKCRVLDDDEGDHSQRMPEKRIHHRSLSSVSISRSNSNVDMNVIPVKETSEDSNEKEEKT